MKAITYWVWQNIKIIAKRSWENSKLIHRKALKKPDNRFLLGTAIVLYAIISYALLADDIKLGLSFLFYGGIAIYAGYIYKGTHTMLLVLIGVALASTLIPSFLPAVKDSFIQRDYVGMIILILFGIFFWYYSSRLKKGQIPVSANNVTNNKPKTRKSKQTRRKTNSNPK
ncbi:MAG: hypothetical protein JXA17_02830 [Dehalococcoidales bacterium]|nr:hypothetical protein [Dehalococcoidales bacterium]